MRRESKDNGEGRAGIQGVFLTRGMRIDIPSFTITAPPNGEMSNVAIRTSIDLCPWWLDIALVHLQSTETAHRSLILVNTKNCDEEIAEALAMVLRSGMQAITASAVAIDAYYAAVKMHIAIPEEIKRAWKRNQLARHKQIAEVLRRAFEIPDTSARLLRDILRQIFEFRGKAVHPSSETADPALYAEINRVTDWRYAAFRYTNAKLAVKLALSVICKTAQRPRKKWGKGLGNYCSTLSEEALPLVKRWEESYGPL